MTVLESIQKSAEFLTRRGVDSPRLQAELLLAHVLKTARLKLYLDFERKLTDAETAEYRELIKRRGAREPLQHLIGSTSFCGLEIKVTSNVLIPRPETELLAEQGWKWLQKREGEPRFLDFGTGSGCIAIALCHFAKTCSGVALDQSASALEIARQNAVANQVDSRLEFIQSDRFTSLAPNAQFDLLISNPPYIPRAEISSLQEEVQKFDPHTALDGGEDGLDFYHYFAQNAAALLKTEARIMLEFGDGQETAISEIFEAKGWRDLEVLKDLTQRPRMLIAQPPR